MNENVLPTPTVKMIEWFDDRFYKIGWVDTAQQPHTEFFASVTTKLGVINKPFLARWRGDVGNREADLKANEGANRGVRIHQAWYTLAMKGVVIYQPWQKPNYLPEEIEALKVQYQGKVAILEEQDEMYAVYKLLCWCNVVKPKFIVNELTVYSIPNRDAGTVDNVIDITGGSYMINGTKPLILPAGRYVLDLKTGVAVDDDADLQLAAYWNCLVEMYGWEFQGSLVLHTGASTKGGIPGLATKYRNKEELAADYQIYRKTADVWTWKNANKFPKVFDFPSMITLPIQEQDATA